MPDAINETTVGQSNRQPPVDESASLECTVEEGAPRQHDGLASEGDLLVSQESCFAHCDPWGEWDVEASSTPGAACKFTR